MFWLITAGVLVLLAVLPLGVSAAYDEGGPLVCLIAGPIRITLLPKQKKSNQPAKEKKETASNGTSSSQKVKGGSASDFRPLVDAVLDFLRDFGRKLRVNRLELDVVLAGGDPCDLAINYGRANAALGGLISQLERFLVIKKRNTQVQCDFLAEKTLVTARVDLTITIGGLFHLGLRHGIRGLRELMNIMKLRKGGAVK
jgi:hypothetical protein